MDVGCSRKDSSKPTIDEPENNKIRIVATVGMIADLVREVGGEHVQVTQLMGSGVDPHLYKPNRDDIQSILDSDLVFFAGHHLEGKMSATLEKLGDQKKVVGLSEQLKKDSLLQDEEKQVDPHLWMDIALWTGILAPIAKELKKIKPGNAVEFEKNAAEIGEELVKLHELGRQAIQTIPKDQRILITSHDAFQYFGRAYGIEVYGIQGLSTESEAGLQRINDLVDLITTKQIAAIFIESSVPKKNIDSLIEGANAKGHTVKIGGELYSDAMGEASSFEGTYRGMMTHNLITVTQALGGQAEELATLQNMNDTTADQGSSE